MPMPALNELRSATCVEIRTYSADKFPQVPGPETTVTVFRCAERQLALFQFINLNVYAVASKDRNGMIESCVDEDSLGLCTRLVQEDEEFEVDFAAYDVSTQPFEAYDINILKTPQPEGMTIHKAPTDFSGEPQ